MFFYDSEHNPVLHLQLMVMHCRSNKQFQKEKSQVQMHLTFQNGWLLSCNLGNIDGLIPSYICSRRQRTPSITFLCMTDACSYQYLDHTDMHSVTVSVDLVTQLSQICILYTGPRVKLIINPVCSIQFLFTEHPRIVIDFSTICIPKYSFIAGNLPLNCRSNLNNFSQFIILKRTVRTKK
ncbi:hypothetical protein SAMN03159341_12524 [Paenibacillus sp. 1_12]|nr:hypothetical protein SAMN03159341_12524 [Paenibacillus sp. 1_12]